MARNLYIRLMVLLLAWGCEAPSGVPMDQMVERGPDTSILAEDSPARCRDGKDNDGDGFIDCRDQDCQGFSFCKDQGGPDRPRPDAPAPPDVTAHDLPGPDVPLDLPPLPDLYPASDASVPDLPAPDLLQPDAAMPDTFAGDTGVPCTSHHDCPQKWFCYLGKCTLDPKMPIFHCSKIGTPPGHWCVDVLGKKGVEPENPAYTCKTACDCGPAHCCKGGICVKDTADPWSPGGTAIGTACAAGKDATYCCATPECHTGKFASDVAERPFRCFGSKGTAQDVCTGKPCFGTACNCSAGESCVDTSHGMPPGKTCLLLEGGTCISNALAQTVYGFKASDILPCCGAGCLAGNACDAGWQRSGGRYGYQRVVGTCGSCGNGYCEAGEYPGSCPKDCTCGDGQCAPSEVVSGCADCKKCGDGKCQAWESPATCSKDCVVCGDSWCTGSETVATCTKDCGRSGRCPDAITYPGIFRICGDKHCSASGCGDPETCLTCPQDCGSCEQGWQELRRTTGWMTNRLKSVWGASASAVFAVGSQGILRFDGQRWGPMLSGENGLEDVWGTSATDVWTVGYGKILHYDGKAWTRNHSPQASLYGVWGASRTEVFAVGGTHALRYMPPPV